MLLEKVERSADDSLINSGSTHRLRDVFRRKGERPEDLNLRDEHSAGNVRWGEWVKVTVEDSGEGIPEEDLEHIFDRFYRVDKSRERENGGTGLGLAIANEFVQAQGGFVQVESKLGEGSRFQVFLPLKKQGGDEKDLTNS